MWTNDIVDAEMDEKHYAYLPGVLMHEFPHTLGIPDLHTESLPHNVTNPAQYKGHLMHWKPEDWKIDLEDELKDEVRDGDSTIVGNIY